MLMEVQRMFRVGLLTWLEVSVVQTQSPALLILQLGQQLPQHPAFIVCVVGDEGVVLMSTLVLVL